MQRRAEFRRYHPRKNLPAALQLPHEKSEPVPRTPQQRAVRVARKAASFQRLLVLARDDNTCCYCGRRLPPKQLTIEHVMPLSRGGNSKMKNLRAACLSCNNRKGSQTVEESGMALRPLRRGVRTR